MNRYKIYPLFSENKNKTKNLYMLQIEIRMYIILYYRQN